MAFEQEHFGTAVSTKHITLRFYMLFFEEHMLLFGKHKCPFYLLSDICGVVSDLSLHTCQSRMGAIKTIRILFACTLPFWLHNKFGVK